MAITDDIIAKEGGLEANPNDKGGFTKFGITKGTLAWYRGVPSVSDDDIRLLSVEEAKAIYQKRYISGPGFDKLPNGTLQSNLIDFGVMSGPSIAILNLQQVINVSEDGILGPKTLVALTKCDLNRVNTEIVKRRALMAARICKKDPSQLDFLYGWLQRFFSFL